MHELLLSKTVQDVEPPKVSLTFSYVSFLLVVFGACYPCVHLLSGKPMKSESLKFS